MKLKNLFLIIMMLFFLTTDYSRASGEKWALIIGINKYSDHNLLPLKYPEKDADEFKTILMEHAGVPEDNIKFLTGSSATRENIKNAIYEFLVSSTLPEDEVYIFFSGYGTFIKDKNSDEEDKLDECLIPYDGKVSVKENNYILDDDLSYWTKNIKSRNLVLIFDAEKASGMDDFVKTRGGVILVATSGYSQIIKEDKDLGGGVFLHFFIKELLSHINSESDDILLKNLLEGTRKKVIEYSKVEKYEITPVIKGSTERDIILSAFPVAMWEGATGIIAFTSDPGGNKDIYLMNSDGSNKFNLTRNSSEDFYPRWSWKGDKIVFISNRTGNFDIFSIDIKGKNLINLTDSPENNYMPAWSPDDEFLVYTSRKNATESIFIVKSDGTDPLKITAGTSWKDTKPLWSNDGRKIAFLSNRSGLNEIYTVNPTGTELLKVTDNKIDEIDFSFSPDGTKIAFTGRYDGQVDLYIMDFDGTGQKKLTNDKGTEYDFSFSPDGRKIAFTTTEYTDNIANISIVEVDSGKISNLTSDNIWKRYPTWSPDGEALIFSAGTQIPTYLYGFNFNESISVKVVGGQANNEEPAWTKVLELNW